MTELWRPDRRLLAVAILALLAYLVLDLRIFPLQTRFVDEERFISEAIAFARTGEFWVWQNRAWEMPLLGLLYGVIYKVVDSEANLIAAARCLQAFLLVTEAWLCADLARRLFSQRTVPALAFIAVLAYPMFVAFQALLLSETLFMWFLVFGIWCLYRWAEAPASSKWLLAYAASMAAATYTKASLTWLPVILPLLVIPPPVSWREAARVMTLAGVIYAVCLSPWWIRNAQLFGQPVWFTTSSSSNLYLGNNPANLNATVDWDTDVEHAFVAAIDRLPELERDRRFHERAMAYIRDEPVQFIHNAWRKFIRFWNIFPNHELHRQGAQLWIIAASYGPVLVLGLLAVWLYRDRWRWLLPIYALIAYFTLVHMVTIASIRYRLPLEPFLVVFAAGAIARLSPGRPWPRA